ncbi:MAG TPA: SRPBCC domain-containing protein [Bdellovibrionales bacterium]|nr:SRPBCC domain-containing protein [Bdellovibrionales bacterium]
MDKETVPVKVKLRYGAPAEKVFDAFLDPKKAGKFMFATVTGKMVKVEIDPKVGGKFLFVDRRPEGDAEHFGTYTELERPKRLAFEFSVDRRAKSGDAVSIDIKKLEKGCEVTLIHHIDADYADYKEKIELGWAGILDALADTL